MTMTELIKAIQQETEWLSTTEEDEVECISIENLEGILTRWVGLRVVISESECLPNTLTKKTNGNFTE